MQVSGMSRSDLIRLVRSIMNAEGTEEEISDRIDLLEAEVSHPRVSDLIYYSDPELTPEQVVDEALSYRPIAPPYPHVDAPE
jgi:hypothetical protein